VQRFWAAFRQRLRLWKVAAGAIGIFLVKVVRWLIDLALGNATIDQIQQWTREYKVSAYVASLVALAEANPATASVIVAAVVVIYAAIRSEIEVQHHAGKGAAPLESEIPLDGKLITMGVKYDEASIEQSPASEQTGGALVYSVTNRDSRSHSFQARLLFYRANRHGGRDILLKIEDAAWLSHFSSITLDSRETGYLVLAVESQKTPQHWSTMHDYGEEFWGHRTVFRSYEIEPITISIEIQLRIDHTESKSFEVSANFKTLSFVLKRT
jgi:hypothetical protein